MKKYLIILLISYLLFPLNTKAEVFGQEGSIITNLTQTLTEAGFSSGQQNVTVEEIAINIVNITLSLFGIVFTILLLYGGWLWMTAAGKQEKIDQAKNTIKRAIIGLAIILTSRAISEFVSHSLFRATGAIQ